MAQVHIVHDRAGNTLTIWFGERRDEHICEEVGGGIVLMKDRSGQIIGLEKLTYAVDPTQAVCFSIETVG